MATPPPNRRVMNKKDEEQPKKYAKVFDSVEELEKSYKLARKKITETTTKLAKVKAKYKEVTEGLENLLNKGSDTGRLIGSFGKKREKLQNEILVYRQMQVVLDKLKPQELEDL